MFSCPKCQSENTQKLSMVYQSGISNTQIKTAGIGIGGSGSVGVGIGKSKGVTRSALSERFSPPKKKRIFLPTFWVFLIGSFIGGMGDMGVVSALPEKSAVSMIIAFGLFMLMAIALPIAFAVMRSKYNKKEFPKRHEEWNNSYLCQRCENIFTPGQA